jgi:hypothetical protein
MSGIRRRLFIWLYRRCPRILSAIATVPSAGVIAPSSEHSISADVAHAHICARACMEQGTRASL